MCKYIWLIDPILHDSYERINKVYYIFLYYYFLLLHDCSIAIFSQQISARRLATKKWKINKICPQYKCHGSETFTFNDTTTSYNHCTQAIIEISVFLKRQMKIYTITSCFHYSQVKCRRRHFFKILQCKELRRIFCSLRRAVTEEHTGCSRNLVFQDFNILGFPSVNSALLPLFDCTNLMCCKQ